MSTLLSTAFVCAVTARPSRALEGMVSVLVDPGINVHVIPSVDVPRKWIEGGTTGWKKTPWVHPVAYAVPSVLVP
jgi:hypothetical protein